MKSKPLAILLTVIGGLMLIPVPWVSLFIGETESEYPGSALAIVPMFLTSQATSLALFLWVFVAGLPALTFWGLGSGLFHLRDRVPRATIVVALVLGALSIVWQAYVVVECFTYALFEALMIAAMSLTLYGMVLIILFRARRSPSFLLNYLGHWLMCFWFAWPAFPFIGEAP